MRALQGDDGADIYLFGLGSGQDRIYNYDSDALGVQAQANGRLLVGGGGRLPYQTGHDRLFAGGDCVRGADLVVTAVQEGRDAAASIVRMLRGAKAIGVMS